MNALLLEKQ